jgi:hypothetical protein
MRIWTAAAGNLRAAMVRRNDTASQDEAWDSGANGWAPLAAGGQFNPTQLYLVQPHGSLYRGQAVQWVDVPDASFQPGAALEFLLVDSHGFVAELLEVRPVSQVSVAVVM